MRLNYAACIAALVLLAGTVIAPVCHGAEIEAIIVANKAVARISSPGEFGSVSQRAGRIDQRITQAISVEDVGSPAMTVRTKPGPPAVLIGDTLLLRVYAGDADRYGCAPRQLAHQWATNFERQFPLAEPCIHMDNPMAASELNRANARAAASANVQVPPADWAIVAVVLEDFARGRVMADPVFERELPELVARVYGEIVRHEDNVAGGYGGPQPPHAPGVCPEPGGCPACRAARKAAVAPPHELGDKDGAHGENAGAERPPVPRRVARRIIGGLRLMRTVDAARYHRDRVMVALTIVKATRKHLASAPGRSAGGWARTPQGQG